MFTDEDEDALRQSYHQLGDMELALRRDCEHHYYESIAGSGTHRRAFVHSVFAMIEGVSYRLKQICLHSKDHTGKIPFSFEETVALQGVTVAIKDNGKVTSQPLRTPTDSDLVFALAMFNKLANSDSPIRIGKGGWKVYKEAKKVRDRLTHPKKVEDLEVDPLSLGKVDYCRIWFQYIFDLSIAYHHRNLLIMSQQTTEIEEVQTRIAYIQQQLDDIDSGNSDRQPKNA